MTICGCEALEGPTKEDSDLGLRVRQRAGAGSVIHICVAWNQVFVVPSFTGRRRGMHCPDGLLDRRRDFTARA